MRNLYTGSKEMLGLIARHNPDQLAIDLRQNSGGDYTVGERWLIHPIRGLASINRRGHLFVLVGAVTFSAAMNNAAQFRSQTAALLVGQTIGEKPNSYAEPREMMLPNSHLTVRYSTRYYKFSEGGANIIRPDREIIPSWADYKAGRDPVLDWVLETATTGAMSRNASVKGAAILLSGGLALVAALTVLFSILVLKVGQARRASKKPNCYYCGSRALRLSSPGGLMDRLLTFWNCVPHRCEICFSRQYRLAGQPANRENT